MVAELFCLFVILIANSPHTAFNKNDKIYYVLSQSDILTRLFLQ